jgi:type VI secretion system protein ImpA
MPATALRQPIPGSDPGGIDLSFLAEFDAIVDARRGDDPSLDQGEWTRELKTADWPRVARLSYDALSERSKDLRIAGWYLEARTQADGLQGFAEGYEVLAALCEEHWSDMHPRAEDDEERLGCLQWIATQSPRWLRGVPLLGKGSESLDTLPSFAERHPEIKLDGAGTVATWRRSMPDEPLHAASASVRAALLAIDALDSVVETQTGSQGPSFSGVRDVLGDVLAALAIPAAAMNYPSDSLRSNDDLPDCSAGFNDSGKRSRRHPCLPRIKTLATTPLGSHRPSQTGKAPFARSETSHTFSDRQNLIAPSPTSRTKPPDGATCLCTSGWARS